ncbi:ribulose phosphate epimerase [Erysipelothrix larvae]|uniref:L-ribulose-5-phosphate 4-epimerase n=1 Tax=Erysipelothrix larvae TaxID=1514105 RepID=A0A109UHP6_9FIRM|nr:L-ribulose-5-phosphate 4-epimerase [Erysipelothrix larvae]AMC94516.1 ribulose phosphate epimerase [Erysipelothrix larvae]
MLEVLREEVYLANMELKNQNLIKYTWGNVSGVCREKKLFVIKPSGVDYEDLSPENMVVCDFDGKVVEGDLNPSSDTLTHAALYKAFDHIGGVVHTHSPWATSWAQAGLDVPVYGTTHADTFYGPVPCARYLNQEEIDRGYEYETGQLIVDTFVKQGIDYEAIPAILLHGHGPFTWGKNAKDAVVHAVVLEEVCKMNYRTQMLKHDASYLPQEILDKHYLRKKGKNAYYGQKKG